MCQIIYKGKKCYVIDETDTYYICIQDDWREGYSYVPKSEY